MEKLCELKKKGSGGGGAYSETLLYQNTSPAATSGGTITLNQSYLDFDFIKIEYALDTSHLTQTAEILIPSDLFSTLGYVGQSSTCRIVLGSANSAGSGGCRYIHALSGTSIEFSNWYQINGTTASSTNAIITAIYGVNV